MSHATSPPCLPYVNIIPLGARTFTTWNPAESLSASTSLFSGTKMPSKMSAIW